MGLLDDAIREHLELKRRRGADPGEVAREQREALDTASATRAAGESAVAEPEDRPPTEGPVASPDVDALSPEADLANDVPSAQGGSTATLGETAELDMRSVLGDEEAADTAPQGAGAGERAAGDMPASSAEPGEPDSLEWEVPGEAVEHAPEESAEDVLEETPEFLRDTPEQDRLWFEQRPPRDFDFDK